MSYVNTFVSFKFDAEIEKAAGGTYEGWVLKYSGANDKVFTKAIHKVAMGYTPALQAKLEALKAGDKFTLVTEKKGAFVSIIDVTVGDALIGDAAQAPKQTSPTPYQPKTYTDNSIGLQVGNALTNASTLIASGASEFMDMTLLDAAKKIIDIGNELRSHVSAAK